MPHTARVDFGNDTVSGRFQPHAVCEAVELAIEFQPRLVLTDLSMPGMNGYEATQAIHAHRRGKNIPVVAVSADCVDSRYVSTDFNGHFIACLGKPWEEEALLQIVTKVLTGGVKPHAAFSTLRVRHSSKAARPPSGTKASLSRAA